MIFNRQNGQTDKLCVIHNALRIHYIDFGKSSINTLNITTPRERRLENCCLCCIWHVSLNVIVGCGRFVTNCNFIRVYMHRKGRLFLFSSTQKIHVFCVYKMFIFYFYLNCSPSKSIQQLRFPKNRKYPNGNGYRHFTFDGAAIW